MASDTMSIMARAIVAKDSCPGMEAEEYNLLVEEEDGELLEQRHTASGVAVTTVATGLQPRTPAAYLVGQSKRLVFCVSEDNILQSYSISHEEDEYDLEPGPISKASIKVHPSSKLAAGWSPLGPVVVYQDEKGNLSSVVASNTETWTVNGPLTGAFKPVIGTPLSIVTSTVGLKLHYLSADGYIHFINPLEGRSARQDHQVTWANLGSNKVKHFIVLPNSETLEAQIDLYVLGSDNSFTLNSANGVDVIGNVNDDGELNLANKEECGRRRRATRGGLNTIHIHGNNNRVVFW